MLLNPGPEVIKLSSCSIQLSMKFVLLINLKLLTVAILSCLTLLSMKISLLINMKMPTVIGIFKFISRDFYMLSWVEHAKSFITSWPEFLQWTLPSVNLDTSIVANNISQNSWTGSEVIKPFSCSTQLSMTFCLLINTKMPLLIDFLYL